MKILPSCLLAMFSMVVSLPGQVPEAILNDLLVSNVYKTAEVIDSIYYFVGHRGDYDMELWRTNGTGDGTYRVADVNTEGSSNPNELTRLGETLYFMAANHEAAEQLYKSDGTAEGTQWVFSVDPDAMEIHHMLTACGDVLFFRTSTPGFSTELWVTDGDTEHTHMAEDICAGQASFPNELTDFNGTLVFVAENCETSGTTLYLTQGLYGPVLQLGGDHAHGLMATEDHLFFVSNFEGSGGELSASVGGISDITLVGDIYPGPQGSDIYHITQVDSRLFFRASDPDHGAELWSYELPSATLQFVKDIAPGSSLGSFPSQLIGFHGNLFFSANDGVHGEELWISDGTEAGTYMLKNINEEPGGVPYHSYPQRFFVTKDLLFFMADDGVHGPELWQTDGTAEGTKMTADIWPSGNQGSDPGGFRQVGDYLIFNAWYGKRTLFRLKLDQSSPVAVRDFHPAAHPLYRFFPNPTHSSLLIESLSACGFHYQILDMAGRRLINGNVEGKDPIRLDISPLEPGMYVLQAESGTAIQTSKLIVR